MTLKIDGNATPQPMTVPAVEDGGHIAEIQCTAYFPDRPSETGQDSIGFQSDNSPPTVSFSSPAAPTIVGPGNIPISGKAADDGVGLDRVSLWVDDPPEVFASGEVTLTANGWQAILPLGPNNDTWNVVLAAEAMDALGNFSPAVFSPAFIVDGVLPTGAVTMPAGGDIGSFQGIQGTARDDVSLARLEMAILDETTGRYWTGSRFENTGGESRTVEVSMSGTESLWTYSQLTAGALGNGHSYKIAGEVRDTAGNRTPIEHRFVFRPTVYRAVGIPRHWAIWPFTPRVTFSPASFRVQYGKPAIVCVEVDTEIPADELTFDSEGQSLSARLVPDPSCPTLAVEVTSSLSQCEPSDTLRAQWGVLRVGQASAEILVPKTETATWKGRFPLSASACARPGIEPPAGATKCVYDEYDITFHGASGMNLDGLVFDENTFVELPLYIGGRKLPMCATEPPNIRVLSAKFAEGSNKWPDYVGWSDPVRFDCGASATQVLWVGACRLPENTHQKWLDKNGLIMTTRSDAQ